MKRLTKAQKALLADLRADDTEGYWWEFHRRERRTVDALCRKGLLELDPRAYSTADFFDARLTEAGIDYVKANSPD